MGIKNIVAIGNSVVDLIYPKSKDAESYLSQLPVLTHGEIPVAPRAGDQIFSPTETLESAAKKFLGQSAKANFNDTPLLETVLGKHSFAAGGSKANAVAAIAWSSIYSGAFGSPLANVKFLSVMDEGPAGDGFIEGMPSGVAIGPRYGACLKVHVIPVEGDKTMLTAPSITKPTDQYDLSLHVQEAVQTETDIVMFEGFTAFGEHFQNLADETLRVIEQRNSEREVKGLEPIELVITASSQVIANIPAFREFVKNATQLTNVTVHANTGEFRRLLDNDQAWRDAYDAANGYPFKGLSGQDEEDAKKAAPGYREAKTAANIDTIENVAYQLFEASPYNLRFVVTDGGNDAYVVNNNSYFVHKPSKIDTSKKTYNVGAGDAFMGGFWVGQLMGKDDAESMKFGAAAAVKVLFQPEARISPDLQHTIGNTTYSGAIALQAEAGLLNVHTPKTQPRLGL